MQITKNKTAAITIAILMTISMGASMMLVPTASAHTPSMTIPSWAYINAFPSPVGVGQTISIFAWMNMQPLIVSGAYGDRYENLTITVTLPDKTTATLGPFESDPVGTIFETYTPTQVGNYTFQFNFPGYTFVGYNPQEPTSPPSLGLLYSVYLGDKMSPSKSDIVTVTVQSTPIASLPAYALPTEYWTNPVSQAGHSATWVYITGDWLSTGTPGSNINDYTTPPQSAHIAWTKPINFGGVAGQPSAIATGGDNYYSYLSYEGMFSPPIIMNGQLYYNIANPPEYGFVDVDLRTGQQVWYQNGSTDPLASQQLGFGFGKQNYPQLSFGQELSYESPNQHGIIDYLWVTYSLANFSSVWAMYDPFTGNWICDLVNIPAGAAFFGASNMITDPSGSFISYTASLDFKTISVWNSTATIQDTYPSNNPYVLSNGYWMWRPPLGALIDASKGAGITTYNTTGVPAAFQQTAVTMGFFGPALSNSMGLSLLGMDTSDQIAIYSNVTAMLGESSYPTPSSYATLAISIAPTTIGQYKWSTITAWPSGNITIEGGFMGDHVWTLFQKETCIWMGFSGTTGAQIWTTKPEVSNHMYGVTGGIYDGVMYSGDSIGEGGNVYAYNVTTGTLLWDYATPSMGNTGYWNNIPIGVADFAAGNMYWTGSEHSPGPNLEPGFMIGDINATTGASIWNITFWSAGGGFGGGLPTADGYITALNAYDNQIYSFGKGPSDTTVQTPLGGVTQGQSFTVQGTVTDTSAGASQTAIKARFPNGLPAVSDNSMTAWMEYVYMQNPIPANVTGVNVSIDAIDPNGNVVHLGTTHSDYSGLYSFQVNPSMLSAGSGTYTVIATFGGSNSYWPSYSESTFTLNSAPTVTPTATPQSNLATAADLMTYIVAGVIAMIIAIAIVGFLILRKHP